LNLKDSKEKDNSMTNTANTNYLADLATCWGDLRECEKAWYMAFWAPIENNVRVLPGNNDFMHVGVNWAHPSDLQLNTVRNEESDELVRTTHWRPTVEQRNALILWLEEN